MIENISNKSVLLKSIFLKIIFGILIGGFVGVLELWLFDFNVNRLIVSFCAGATFGVLLSLFGSYTLNRRMIFNVIYMFVYGLTSGIVWWFLAKENIDIYIPALIGGIIGVIWLIAEGNLKSS